ncbi:hypothetical protein ACFU5O_32475 [Streptomyces sp. NPDC057445]|uniref:hypothetical protein n=1 Tax=Streptomyces sp. NPDC057445 TaxID=3346136 RepID=UPI003684F519
METATMGTSSSPPGMASRPSTRNPAASPTPAPAATCSRIARIIDDGHADLGVELTPGNVSRPFLANLCDAANGYG